MRTVAIIHGWAEGPWHSRQLRKLLKNSGFELAGSANTADVLIAHSLGCYLIPNAVKAKLVVVVDPPYWPTHSMAYKLFKKQVEDFTSSRKYGGTRWWLSKLIWNLWYIITKPWLTVYAFTRCEPSRIPEQRPSRKVIIVRNQDDTFCSPDILNLLKSKYSFHEFPGGHDDIWIHPQPYIDLILKEL